MVFLGPALYKALRELAHLKGIPMSALVREILEREVPKDPDYERAMARLNLDKEVEK